MNVPQILVSGMSRVNGRYYTNITTVDFRCICQKAAKTLAQ